MKINRRAARVVLVLKLVVGAALVACFAACATAAQARVLANAPASRICVGRAIRVGVWYQSYSGGPRWLRIAIHNPRDAVVWRKSGSATTTWRYFKYHPRRAGFYRTVYTTADGKVAFKTRVRACGS
jgi:hypothetical protein